MIFRRSLLVLLSLLAAFPVASMAQFTAVPIDARSGAMGGCIVPLSDSNIHLSVGYRQGFLVDGMSTRSIAAATPLGHRGRLAAFYTHFGDPDYHEQQASAAYSLSLSDAISVGIYGLYSYVGTADSYYASLHYLDAGASFVARIKKHSAYLVAGSRRWDQYRPWMMRAGVVYRPLRTLLTLVEIDVESRTRFRGGIEYAYRSGIMLRGGIATNPISLTFGAGYQGNHYHIDLSTEVHSTLGLSPQITLGLCL